MSTCVSTPPIFTCSIHEPASVSIDCQTTAHRVQVRSTSCPEGLVVVPEQFKKNYVLVVRAGIPASSGGNPVEGPHCVRADIRMALASDTNGLLTALLAKFRVYAGNMRKTLVLAR